MQDQTQGPLPISPEAAGQALPVIPRGNYVTGTGERAVAPVIPIMRQGQANAVPGTGPAGPLAGLEQMVRITSVENTAADGSRPLPLTPMRASIPRNHNQQAEYSPPVPSVAARPGQSGDPMPELYPEPVTTLQPDSRRIFPASPSAVEPTSSPQDNAKDSPQSGNQAKIYSQNTQAVWHSRRASRLWTITTALLLVGLLALAAIYWTRIGAPTRVEDMPFIRSLLQP